MQLVKKQIWLDFFFPLAQLQLKTASEKSGPVWPRQQTATLVNNSLPHFQTAESGASQTPVLNNEDSRPRGKVKSLLSSKTVTSSLMCWWPSADQRLQTGTPSDLREDPRVSRHSRRQTDFKRNEFIQIIRKWAVCMILFHLSGKYEESDTLGTKYVTEGGART